MKIIADLYHNLLNGLRLCLFLSVRQDGFRVSLGQASLWTLLFLVTAAAEHYLLTDETRQFHPAGLNAMAMGLFSCLAAVVVVSLLDRERPKVLPLYTVLLAATPLVTVAWTGYSLLTARAGLEESGPVVSLAVSLGLYLVLLLWSILLAIRAIRLVHGGPKLRSAAQVVAYLVIVWGTAYGIPRDPVWYDDDDNLAINSLWSLVESSDPEKLIEMAFTEGEKRKLRQAWKLDVEEVYGQQPLLLEAALDGLAPQRRSIVDLYFVAWAGYAYQDVFRNEVREARALFDERFDTADRSVVLINHVDTVWDQPMASLTNLRKVLNRFGSTMDADEDIAFVFLTSHGSQDHRLSADFGTLRPNPLSARDLKQALDESGIRWRVVVVSACYSGGFVDVLRDENTMVISASRRDLTSFGCSDDAEFTYFSGALFDEALRSETSFEHAFAQARKRVAERERAIGVDASEPQIHVGAAIRERLSIMERRLERLAFMADSRPTSSMPPVAN